MFSTCGITLVGGVNESCSKGNNHLHGNEMICTKCTVERLHRTSKYCTFGVFTRVTTNIWIYSTFSLYVLFFYHEIEITPYCFMLYHASNWLIWIIVISSLSGKFSLPPQKSVVIHHRQLEMKELCWFTLKYVLLLIFRLFSASQKVLL